MADISNIAENKQDSPGLNYAIHEHKLEGIYYCMYELLKVT
jgi:hypothetical protein